MGLVDYSDSDSDSEDAISPGPQDKRPASTPTTSKSTSATGKPFQKFVSRSNPGKIVVSLPSTASDPNSIAQQSGDEPPTKRARTGGGGRFSNFSSFLPPPKTVDKPALSASTQGWGKPLARPGIHLKTGAEPAFDRTMQAGNGVLADGMPGDAASDTMSLSEVKAAGHSGPSLKLPPPKNGHPPSPSVPSDMKAAENVKLVGKPLMFKPLSVARKPAKKTTTKSVVGTAKTTGATETGLATGDSKGGQEVPVKKKISLFSLNGDNTATDTPPMSTSTGPYEPLFGTPIETESDLGSTYDETYGTYDSHTGLAENPTLAFPPKQALQQPFQQQQSLSDIADDLNLSASERRELLGRKATGPAAGAPAAGKVINFDMEKEYAHNEAVRASGQIAVHNPVRNIMPGKHNLRQLVTAVQGNRSALEESFATAKSNRKDAAGRYGWR
ncbi:hypothetical protein VTK73DRAFT_2975 [Phialemonium thermophilum]|uniref:Mitotic checkpoint regulator, MAD2B-interacting-domain-containing protein n=1 Tax=Phialemonium thermophilum TaxID=223376 RepID=A0ABR3Y139_9PEZI